MTIERRAEMVADVAGDCLVKLLRVTLGSDEAVRRVNDDWSKAWDGLQSTSGSLAVWCGTLSQSSSLVPHDAKLIKKITAALRSTYIFPDYSPPFPLLADIISSFHPLVQSSFNPITLTRAVSLSNLATFVWTILQPDEVGDMLEDTDDASENGKKKWKSTELKRIRRRNRMLLLAWKKFWVVVVPREKRSSESAVRLWLDLATQARPSYQPS